MIVTHTIGGIVVNPVNKNDLSISINHEQSAISNTPQQHVGINNLHFAREDVLKIMQLLNTAPGITEGVPYEISILERGKVHTLKMYIDLMEGLSRSNDGIKVSVKMLGSFEWLEDKLNGFTLESMYDEINVSPFTIDGITYNSYQNYFDKKFIYLPYTVDTEKESFLLILSLIYIATELSKIIKFITQWTMPMVGLGVTVAIGQLIAEIVFGLVQILALLVLPNNLYKCVIQPVKYHAGMLMVDMLKVVSAKIGKTFNSSIYDVFPFNQIAYLPEKYNTLYESTAQKNSVLGIDFSGFKEIGFNKIGYATSAVHDSSSATIQKGYLVGTGADVFSIAKTLINGKIIPPINTDKILLERKDYHSPNASFTLKPLRQDWNGYNTDEYVSNTVIKFALDFQDTKSTEKYEGNILQATQTQINISDKSLVLGKGFNRIDIPCARGVRKEELTLAEEIYGDLDFVFNKIVGNAAILAINVVIGGLNVVIVQINLIVTLFNLVLSVINIIIKIINAIVKIVGGNGTTPINTIHLFNTIPPLKFMSFIPFNSITFKDRIGCLLLDTDTVSVPKLLLVDTNRVEFNRAGGFSGKQRIAYLHKDNSKVINAEYFWDNFYFINSFSGNSHSRKTKISPALNSDSDTNRLNVSLAEFEAMAREEKITDNFGEDAFLNKLVWYPEKNGIAEISFSKKGWLTNPQSNNPTERAKEIFINLQIKKSLPNGK